MSESETCENYGKMLAGEPFLGYAPRLQELQMQARKRLANFNALAIDDEDGRKAAMREMFGSCGDEFCTVIPPFHFDYGIHIHLGNCFINTGATFLDCNTVTIGDYTTVGPNVQFLSVSHPVDPFERIPKKLVDGQIDFSKSTFAQPIIIGERCWIGAGTIIMPGVTIGNGTTVGAGSIVTRSLPEYVLALGRPAQVIRELET